MPDDSSNDESTLMSNEEKCRKLKKKRAVLKGKLTKYQKKIDEATESGDTTQIWVRFPTFEKHLEEFETIQGKIEELEDNDDDNDYERSNFEDTYFELLAKTKALLPNTNGQLSNNESHVNMQQITAAQNALSRIKLQPLDIPKFNGKYEDWRSFQDIFTSMVHNNIDISDAQKLLYLSDSLVGEAREVIKFLNITSENYEVARNLLIERYDKKQYIINAHINSLFDLPPMTKDSPAELRKLISSTKQHLRSIEALQLPIQDWDPMIIVLIKRKLDPITRRQWDLAQKNPNKIAPLKELYEFLEQRCFGLETNTPEKSNSNTRNTNQTSIRSTAHLATNSTSEQQEVCKLCPKSHNLYQCDIFIKQPISERIKTIKTIGACFNCLRQGHPVRQCKTRHCKNCDGKHHTMIHQEKTETQKSTSNNHVVLNTTYSNHSEVLLSTALIQVQNAQGQWIPCRALLDSASQSNFITQALAKRLNSKVAQLKVSVNGISHKGTEVNATTNVQLKSRISNFSKTIECLIIRDITVKLPTMPVATDKWNLPCIQLADPTFGEPGTVDMLIGAELYFNLLERDQIKLGEDLPILQNTVFGWVASGKSQVAAGQTMVCHLTTLELHKSIENFWNIEELEEKHHTTREEQQCENHFQETHQRDETGRFIVKLPKRTEAIALGDSATNGLKRLPSMEKRMHKDPAFEKQYISFIDEYKNLNHMTEVPFDHNQKANYLPHHAVIKDTSTTTKLRVVFDGSSKTSSGVSLNDILLVGPKLQPDLFRILVRFRQHTYVVTADIEKMYRQILVHQDDRHLQHILWRDKTNHEVKSYQLNTVTYGLTSSPYLAIRCINQLAYEHETTYPKASKVILNDFYVDDLLTGDNTIEKVQQLKKEITTIMQLGKFHLRKWKSNNIQLTNDDQSSEATDLLMDPSVSRTLGISWQPNGDYLQYSVMEEPTGITKRQVLSQIAKLFDPLGLLSPIILQAKLVMQQIWLLKIGWDQPLPTSLQERWNKFTLELPSINSLKIQRQVMAIEHIHFQIHAFSDASEKGYGAAIYIRSSQKNLHTTRLLCAKSRVAPLKTISLPRLELCAALLSARLCQTVQTSLSLKPNEVFYWCDSTITLHWIQREPCHLKTFVANRIAEIQSLTNPSKWYHVPTQENPADLVSRGLNPSQLILADLWWTGPQFLEYDESQWPENIVPHVQNDPEAKTTSLITIKPSPLKFDILTKFSSWSKLVRILAYCLRFMYALRKTKVPKTQSLTVEEIEKSRIKILQLVQQEHFHAEIKSLQSQKIVHSTSNLKLLNPFFDQVNSVIRVGGRLKRADICIDQKHPIILPAHHFITNLILTEQHEKLDHCGPAQLLATIRLHYWPIAGRNLARKVVRTCVKCIRYKPVIPEYIMADLPADRVTSSRPFSITGVDYAGPVQIREARRRGRYNTTKAYIAVFVCFSTKAVHLELVTSLTTESFLAALYRFISRRGLCSKIFSDNGTNFVGTNRELNEMYDFVKTNHEYISKQLSKRKIEWHFIPPRAPHFGGIWEAAVKSFKKHFYKVSHNLKLTFEECYTLITQIEAILNSRPLVPLSSDPNDLSYLCPAHFLIGDYLLEPPSPSYLQVVDNRLSIFQHIQKVKQHFWDRWKQDYLQHLQLRSKWSTGQHDIQVGTMVILAEDTTPPLQWALGRVIAVHPGEDGVVRVVSVKTSTGEFKRPVKRLCELPVQ